MARPYPSSPPQTPSSLSNNNNNDNNNNNNNNDNNNKINLQQHQNQQQRHSFIKRNSSSVGRRVLLLFIVGYTVSNIFKGPNAAASIPSFYHQYDEAISATTTGSSPWSNTENSKFQPDNHQNQQNQQNQQPSSSLSSLLKHQIKLQNDFQDLIQRLQHPTIPCHQRRILMTAPRRKPYDGFCKEVQQHGRHLQVAMATDRTFVFHNDYVSAYAPTQQQQQQQQHISRQCVWKKKSTTNGGDANTFTIVNMSNVTLDWDCMFRPLSNCTEDMIRNGTSHNTLDDGTYNFVNASHELASSYGILLPPPPPPPTSNDTTTPTTSSSISSHYFDALYYGPQRIVRGVNFQRPKALVDTLEYWDRTMGRYWVRAQMVHYLWKPSIGLQAEMQSILDTINITCSTTTSKASSAPRYIGMHIRLTDNIGTFRRDFGRDATVTRSVERAMHFAQKIRNEQSDVRSIYLATDSNQVLEALQAYVQNNTSADPDAAENTLDWTIHVQPDAPRHAADTKQDEWLWFQGIRSTSAAAIATDVELLRRADYLIGSHHSNVFRLAAELNTAHFVDKYPLSLNRHHAVDIPWFEDP